MQRETWTDEGLDDLSRRMDQGFDRVETDIHELRSEFGNVRREMKDGFDELRGLMLRMGAGIIGTIVVATLLHGI